MRNNLRLAPILALVALTFAYTPAMSTGLAPWLELPSTWEKEISDGVLHTSPTHLDESQKLVMLIKEPESKNQAIESDFAEALKEFPTWLNKPVTSKQATDSGWVFLQGVGSVESDGVAYTVMVSVARQGKTRAIFWTLADSDATMNAFMPDIGNAIASVQDYQSPSIARGGANAQPQNGAVTSIAQLPKGFGQGISGVYVGVERGLSAGAGASASSTQAFNPSTGRIENSQGITAQTQLSIRDAEEVDVFYPDGTYRRRLPMRGLASDLNWEKQQQAILWGTWTKQGNKIVTQRGNYRAIYTVSGNDLVSERGRVWQKVPLAKDVRFKGRFVRSDYRGANVPSLTFSSDGRYQDHDDFLKMIGSAFNLVVPDGEQGVKHWSDAQTRSAMGSSAGRYEFSAFTLTFRADDGRVWQFPAYVTSEQAKGIPNGLNLNQRELILE